MSVEVDFVQSDQAMQAAGTQRPWAVSASWLDDRHLYALSFVPDSNRSNLQVVSQSFVNDPAGNISFEVVINNNGEDAVFRAALIQAPSKF